MGKIVLMNAQLHGLIMASDVITQLCHVNSWRQVVSGLNIRHRFSERFRSHISANMRVFGVVPSLE